MRSIRLRSIGGKAVDFVLGGGGLLDIIRELLLNVFDSQQWLGVGPAMIVAILCFSALALRHWDSGGERWRRWRLKCALGLAIWFGLTAGWGHLWGLANRGQIVERGRWLTEQQALECALSQVDDILDYDISRVVMRQAMWRVIDLEILKPQYTCEPVSSLNDTTVEWKIVHTASFRQQVFNSDSYDGLRSFTDITGCTMRFWSDQVLNYLWHNAYRDVPKRPPIPET